MKKITLAFLLAGMLGYTQVQAANAIIENEYVKAGVSYAVNKTSRIALSADRQEHNSLSTDTVGLYGKINF